MADGSEGSRVGHHCQRALVQRGGINLEAQTLLRVAETWKYNGLASERLRKLQRFQRLRKLQKLGRLWKLRKPDCQNITLRRNCGLEQALNIRPERFLPAVHAVLHLGMPDNKITRHMQSHLCTESESGCPTNRGKHQQIPGPQVSARGTGRADARAKCWHQRTERGQRRLRLGAQAARVPEDSSQTCN